MAETMCCPLESGDYADAADFHTSTIRKAAKDHRCYECREAIPKGSKYEYASGCWDGIVDTFKTCLSCVEIRNHFSCGRGFIYGQLWDDLEQNFFPDMKAGGPCMKGLSPAAKSRLFELRMKWWEATNE